MTPRMCRNGLHDLTLPGAVVNGTKSACRRCRNAAQAAYQRTPRGKDTYRRHAVTPKGRASQQRKHARYGATIKGALNRFATQVRARSAAHLAQAEELGMDIEP